MDPVEAWMKANAEHRAWECCAMDPQKYHFYKRKFRWLPFPHWDWVRHDQPY